jgi:hypothetical protein
MREQICPVWLSGEWRTTRREFLASCAALGLFLRSAPGAHQAPPADTTDVGLGLVRALLAFDQPGFPDIAPEEMWRRIRSMFFDHATDERVTFDRALLMFDQLALFGKTELIPQDEGTPGDAWQLRVTAEQRAFQTWLDGHGNGAAERFRDLSLAQQRSYLLLWARSGVVERRRFYRAAKAVVMVAAYSHERLWQAIGYEGPFRESRP